MGYCVWSDLLQYLGRKIWILHKGCGNQGTNVMFYVEE